MRHNKSDIPCYVFFVNHRVFTSGKGKLSCKEAIASEASPHIETPITENDIEVEIAYSTHASEGVRTDADNILKPILDALNGVAYVDDRQVRSVTSTVFNRRQNLVVSGMVQYLGKLFRPKDDVVMVQLYSDSRLSALGGTEKVEKSRFDAWQKEFDKIFVK